MHKITSIIVFLFLLNVIDVKTVGMFEYIMHSTIDSPVFGFVCFGIDNINEYGLQSNLYTHYKESAIGYNNKILANTRIYFALKLTIILMAELSYHTNGSSKNQLQRYLRTTGDALLLVKLIDDVYRICRYNT